MQYFELFGLPVQFRFNQGMLTRTYIQLQKKYHPDFYGQSSDFEKADALEISSMINKAYKTFKNQDLTIQYILTEKGLLEEGENYKLSPDFLMEVMELNELKMEDADPVAIKQRAESILKEIYADVEPLMESYNEETSPEADLLKIKDYYYKKKYIDRLLAE